MPDDPTAGSDLHSTPSATPDDADSDEIGHKLRRVADFLPRHGLDAVWLWNRGSFAWATAGGDNHIPNNSGFGVAGILMTGDRRWCLCNAIEAPRMRDEELVDTGIEVVEYPWHDPAAASRILRDFFGDHGMTRVGCDRTPAGLDLPAVADLPGDFNALRWQLTPTEVDRYREAGERAAGAVERAAVSVEPGMNENEIAGVVDHCARAAGLIPVVNLVAVDDRIRTFRHPPPTGAVLARQAMLVLCGSFGGLTSNLTRFVRFGEADDADLQRRRQAAADLDTTAILATRPGRTFGDVFTDLQAAYAAAGFPDAWTEHHQGGSTGYAGREIFASPGDPTVVLDNQAFAWNPSVAGAKSEDTVLVTDDGVEILTGCSHDWPTVTGRSPDGELPRAGTLVR